VKRWSRDGADEYAHYYLAEEDVVLAMDRPWIESGLKWARIRADELPLLLVQRVARMRGRNDLDTRFLRYLIGSPAFTDYVRSITTGANVPHISGPDIKKYRFALPPKAVQRRIAHILSAYDDLTENNSKRIKILEEMARSLYREWFIEFRFPGYETAKFVETKAGRLPNGWAVETIGASASLINRGVSPKYEDDGPELVVNQKCIRDQRLSLEPARRHNTKVPAEKYVRTYDVLINSTGVGTLGRVTQVMRELEVCTVDTHVTIVRPGSRVRPHFWGQALLAKEAHFEALGTGATGQTELGRSRIAETALVVPSGELQDRFDQAVAAVRSDASVLLAKQGVLQATRDLLLPRLISGEIELPA
jgi:type I restriction enzyme S subunit